MLVNLPARLICVGLSSALLISSPALASGPTTWADAATAFTLGPRDGDITPDSANSARFGIEQQGQQLIQAGAHEQAAELYWSKGIELADPVLIVDAAEAWREQAATQRSIVAAQTAIDRVQLALDMLYFLRDSASSASWQPVAPEYLGVVIDRARAVVTDAEALIAEIEAEQAAAAQAANAPEQTERQRKPAKPGTGLIAGGSAAIVLGLGGAGLGVAGLVLGGQAQADVEDPTVYEPEHSAAEARGRTANLLAGVGIGVAVVGISVGAALIALGNKQRKRSPTEASAQVTPTLMCAGLLGLDCTGAGLSVQGRF
ncbi:hypothetical protein [Enhygromyxa salina]|uniref:Secreted protein n=1 Tax=Enhygromyxa salina TaxID=215803 RepID=A0A2S9XLA2_9BACT|nr:hypothetical protein [Enhygromyxa salina]PRP93635.1 hypothetical protein ENSA7_80630 [Enhygromyxa salina]